MALTQCTECKKDISTEATNCPHCGYPIKEMVMSSEESLKPIEDYTLTPEEERDLFEYEYTSRKRKVITRIISFVVVTLISLIWIVDFSSPYWLEDMITVPMLFGGIAALLFGKMMEDGLGEFFVKFFQIVAAVISFLISLLQNIFVIIIGGLISIFLALFILGLICQAIAWVLGTLTWLVIILSFVPFVLSVVFTVLDIRFLKNNKEAFCANNTI